MKQCGTGLAFIWKPCCFVRRWQWCIPGIFLLGCQVSISQWKCAPPTASCSMWILALPTNPLCLGQQAPASSGIWQAQVCSSSGLKGHLDSEYVQLPFCHFQSLLLEVSLWFWDSCMKIYFKFLHWNRRK